MAPLVDLKTGIKALWATRSSRSWPSPGSGRPRREIEDLSARELEYVGVVEDHRVRRITGRGAAYRGLAALDLAERGVRFESVCELLWGGALPQVPPAFRAPPPVLPRAKRPLLERASFVERMQCAVPFAALADPLRFGSGAERELACARELVRALGAALAPDARRERASLRAPGVAEAALAALGAATTPERVEATHRVLVISADHELNVSAFAARVVASAGADLYAAVSAALAAFSGPAHGASSDRVEALLDEVGAPSRARAVLRERARRGEAIAGFGHPLYPGGDPRAQALLRLARRLGPQDERQRVLSAVIRQMDRAEQLPNLDSGLVAVCIALGLPRGAASALFALGRSAGWIAHALEQRSAGFLLRPRARYVGPDPGT